MMARWCSSFAFSGSPLVTYKWPPPPFAALICGSSMSPTCTWSRGMGRFMCWISGTITVFSRAATLASTGRFEGAGAAFWARPGDADPRVTRNTARTAVTIATRRLMPGTGLQSRGRSQRPQEVQDVLFLSLRQRLEEIHDRVRLGCLPLRAGGALVEPDRFQEVAAPPIMQEEEALTESPQRRRPELVPARLALHDVVRQAWPHAMQQKIREELHGLLAQRHHR